MSLELCLFLPSFKRVGRHLLSWVKHFTFIIYIYIYIYIVNWHGCPVIKNSFLCQMQLSTFLSTFSGEVAMDPVLKTLYYFFEYKMMDKVQKPNSAECNVTHTN